MAQRELSDDVLGHVTLAPKCELCHCEELVHIGSFWYTPNDKPKTYAKYMKCPDCGYSAKYSDEPDSPRFFA
jgi:hypothetical protein